MRWLERIGTAWTALTSKSAPPAGSYSYGWGGGSSWSDAFKFRRAPSPAELADAYKSIVYACVNLNANAVARTPLRLYAVTKGGQTRPKCAVQGVSRRNQDRLKHLDYAAKAVAGAEHVEEVTDHPLLDAVQKVNEDLDHTQLITYTAMCLDIVGAAYWWPSMGRFGLPEELWALPPHLVFPVFTSGTMVPDAYNFGGEIYPKDQLVRFRRLSAKNPYGQGYGPEQAAIEYARLEDTFVSLQDDLLSNGPRPSVIVSHKDPRGAFGPAERQRLEMDMERRGRGGRAGGVFVVDGAATVTPVSYSPTDLGALNVSSYDVERIANCFDVPISMLKTEDVNRANAEAGQSQHARNAVEPRCRLIASTLTRWTHSLDRRGQGGYDRLFWAFDAAVTEDKVAEATLHKTYIDLGVLTRNEVRLELGYEPVTDGDSLLIPGGLKPLSEIIEASSQEDKEPSSSASDAFEADDANEPEEASLPSHKEDLGERGKSIVPLGRSQLPWDDGWGGRSWGETSFEDFTLALEGEQSYRFDLDTKWNPCRDERGRFAPCGGRKRPTKGRRKRPPASRATEANRHSSSTRRSRTGSTFGNSSTNVYGGGGGARDRRVIGGGRLRQRPPGKLRDVRNLSKARLQNRDDTCGLYAGASVLGEIESVRRPIDFSKVREQIRANKARGDGIGLESLELERFLTKNVGENTAVLGKEKVTEGELAGFLRRGHLIALVDSNHWIRVLKVFRDGKSKWVSVYDSDCGNYEQLLSSFMTRAGQNNRMILVIP